MKENFMGRPITRNSPADYPRELAENIVKEATPVGSPLFEKLGKVVDTTMSVGKQMFGGAKAESPAETKRKSDKIKKTLDNRQKGKAY